MGTPAEETYRELMLRARVANHQRDAARRSSGGKTPLQLGAWASLDHTDYLLEQGIRTGKWHLAAEGLDYLRCFVRHYREGKTPNQEAET
jgi:hypothetical protein